MLCYVIDDLLTTFPFLFFLFFFQTLNCVGDMALCMHYICNYEASKKLNRVLVKLRLLVSVIMYFINLFFCITSVPFAMKIFNVVNHSPIHH
jgi:hypothetical protein